MSTHNSHSFHPALLSVLREAVRGKSVGRTMTNLFWQGRIRLEGTILDIGGGEGGGSHYRFLPIGKTAKILTADIVARTRTDFVLDITKEKVPLTDGTVDSILLFNVLEHLSDHDIVLKEVRRLLRPGGRLIGSVPFLLNVHPDPHDYVRFTGEALEALFKKHGFPVRAIEPIGRGPFLAAYEQLDMLLWSPLHLLFLPVVWCLDGLLSILRPKRNFRAQFPLFYNFIVEKSSKLA